MMAGMERKIVTFIRRRRDRIQKSQKTMAAKAAYDEGVQAFKNEIIDNPYGKGEMRLMCAWSAGWFDAKRGMVK